MNFNNRIYESYLAGNTSLTDMIKEFHTTEYELKLYFKEHNLKYRRQYLYDTTVHTFFDTIDSEIKAYLLGFYFADGGIYKGMLKISIGEEDREIIELFKSFISPNRKIRKINGQTNKKTGYVSKPMVAIDIKSDYLCERLEKYGMGHRKTYETTTALNMIPDEFMIDFIRGYFDGDGTVCVTSSKKPYNKKNGETTTFNYQNYNWSIISKRSEHLNIIKSFLNKKYDIHSNIINDKKGNFLIEINRKKDFKKIMEILYKGKKYYLKRKLQKYLSYNIKPDKPKILKYFNGSIISRFDSLANAGKDAGITPQGIKLRIKKKLNVNGYTWGYEM